MYKQCTTEQSAARQRQLEQGLLELMLKKHYEEFSVSDLCEVLGIPRKSFYRYFSSKEGALFALIDHALMDYDVKISRWETESQGELLHRMQEVFSYWVEHRALLDALGKSGLSGILIQRAMEFAREREIMPDFLQILDGRLREYGTMFTVCGLMTMIVQWHQDGFAKSPEAMAELTIQLLTQPLFSVHRK